MLQRSGDSPGAGALWSAQLALSDMLMVEDRHWSDRKAIETAAGPSYDGEPNSAPLKTGGSQGAAAASSHATRQAI